ncbi:hypothetical protein [Leptospira kanakyensis]|uniref:hypothetical protein n=1 Tax=Leptospira kanakyensis TaxID=2484968 RepID=UPI00223CD9F5|nr:hypothetical protein [Leptospira kanakyensis]MCW7471397.1 hypothetical protein [Leptospira kanakyensis]
MRIETNYNKLPDLYSGRGLFVYSDPGGAKAVLSQAFDSRGSLESYEVVSDRHYDFTKDFLIPVSIFPSDPAVNLNRLKPTFLFTGTSYTSQIELRYIQLAKQFHIPCYAFVDHWTSFLKRFTMGDEVVFPDHILVIDSVAKEKALSEGIPENRISIFGNPYYQYLMTWVPTREREAFFKAIGLDPNRKLILFAPEPLSNVNGSEIFGFDEIFAMNVMKTIVDKIHFRFQMGFKPHPNQNLEILKTSFPKNLILLDQTINPNELLYHSEMVIGFFSNMLVEAKIMGKKVLRYHPKEAKQDPLSHLNIGEVVDSDSLQQILSEFV